MTGEEKFQGRFTFAKLKVILRKIKVARVLGDRRRFLATEVLFLEISIIEQPASEFVGFLPVNRREC